LMFKTIVGAMGTEEDACVFFARKRPKAFSVNFKKTCAIARAVGIPFGIAQMGKSFRKRDYARGILRSAFARV